MSSFFYKSGQKVLCPWKIFVYSKFADFDTTVLRNAKVKMFLPLFSIQILGHSTKERLCKNFAWMHHSTYSSNLSGRRPITLFLLGVNYTSIEFTMKIFNPLLTQSIWFKRIKSRRLALLRKSYSLKSLIIFQRKFW